MFASEAVNLVSNTRMSLSSDGENDPNKSIPPSKYIPYIALLCLPSTQPKCGK
jgi:hypothetical protein